MKYIIGAIFMMVICALWIHTRLIPQQQDYYRSLMECRAERANEMAKFLESEMKQIGRN